jgi:hypothetical protein
MGMLMQFGQVLGRGMFVQFLNRVVVLVLRLLARCMNVGMRMLVGVRMFVGVRMDRAIGMPMLVGVDVRVNVRVQMFVFDLGRHEILLGKGGRFSRWPSLTDEFYAR